jgi:protein-S-isoprenylcysteine O-methyltransferase Ste14
MGHLSAVHHFVKQALATHVCINPIKMLSDYINLQDSSLWLFLGLTLLCPTYWNFIARQQYKHKVISSLFGGNIYAGIYALAISIFSLSGYRDYVYHLALEKQPQVDFLAHVGVNLIGYTLTIMGTIFVLTSFYKLGIVGTYLGDYFGVLMKERVTTFPFNVLEHPMYVGSTLNFLGMALVRQSLTGILLSGFVYACYHIAGEYFEGPFTTQIYEDAKKSQ